ncbi:hypothetical protein BS47DRAFT_1398590 [Hydnum rufescens UP504]|uniref:Uncharacterized protein n=1 Tax=Hydnum rufescens UP504 TaxID=1448309 RepID=A0A9P6DQJ7_9AGAM|nr:hypothetical protein BS47DRAFT_1398590 [Hydnum rufescens UP504]
MTHADIVNEILALLDNGTLPKNILLDKSLPSLRDHSLHWIVKGFKKLLGDPDLIQKWLILNQSLLLITHIYGSPMSEG